MSDDYTELTASEFDHQGYIRPKRIMKKFNMTAFCKYTRSILFNDMFVSQHSLTEIHVYIFKKYDYMDAIHLKGKWTNQSAW